jgi:two-component system, NtrC family, sensor histidine kinase HydH
MKELRDWLALFASVGHLSLAVTALVAGRQSPLRRPVAALCFALFGWNFATLAQHLIKEKSFTSFDSFFTAISPPLVLEVVLTFVGRSRAWRNARLLAWLVFGSLALASLGGLVSSRLLDWQDEPSWSVWFLFGWLPVLVFEIVVLGRYLAQTTDAREKARARTVLLALAIGSSFSMSDVARSIGLPTPYLGSLGTLIAAALLATLAVRFELFDRNVSTRTTVYVLGLIVAFVVAYLVIFSAFAGHVSAQVFASAVVTLLALAAARELVLARAAARDRTQHLAVLGRFAAQMAHDIKGPLTALLGATQVLDSADDEDTRKEFLSLVTEQAKRISAIVERYDRMGRIEPRKTLVRVNEVVRAVARAHALSDDRLALDVGDPECEADRELLESAVENVVRNAVEAAKNDAARVSVETLNDTAARAVVVRVVDKGEGMDPRTLERAVEDFFTTKESGSGLGLAFVRRVLVAHGGDVKLASEKGVGTTVELRLPR